MGDKTGIQWTDATWNPIRGCSRVSEGCRNCYAETVANRFKGPGQPYEGLIAKGGQWNGNISVAYHLICQALRWRKPRRIFVNSMSDLFHENVPENVIDKIFAVMTLAPQHTFQILTKRPQRMKDYLSSIDISKRVISEACEIDSITGAQINADFCIGKGRLFPLSNVWLGVSVEDQDTADKRIPLLLQTPAAVRWISAEPLIGRVDLCEHLCMWWNQTMKCFESSSDRFNPNGIDWVVVGGESGPGARPMQAGWARSLRDQCQASGVAYFFKQWGEFAPNWYNDNAGNKIPGSEWMDRMGKKSAGRLLDGREWNEYPEPKS